MPGKAEPRSTDRLLALLAQIDVGEATNPDLDRGARLPAAERSGNHPLCVRRARELRHAASRSATPGTPSRHNFGQHRVAHGGTPRIPSHAASAAVLRTTRRTLEGDVAIPDVRRVLATRDRVQVSAYQARDTAFGDQSWRGIDRSPTPGSRAGSARKGRRARHCAKLSVVSR